MIYETSTITFLAFNPSRIVPLRNIKDCSFIRGISVVQTTSIIIGDEMKPKQKPITQTFQTRYEITTKPGAILDADLVKRVVTAKPKSNPTIIVYVDSNNTDAFEKQIEANTLVLRYQADPRAPGTITKDWIR